MSDAFVPDCLAAVAWFFAGEATPSTGALPDPMNRHRMRGFLLSLLFLFWFPQATCAQPELPPKIDDLVRAGNQTIGKLGQTPATWVTRCSFPNGLILEVKAARANNRRAWSFFQVTDGRPAMISRIVEAEGIWHILEPGRNAKYRPFEAELRLPGGYLLLSLAEPRCVVDKTQFESAKFEKRGDDLVFYRAPLPPENRRIAQQAVRDMELMVAQDPEFMKRRDAAKTYEFLKEQLAKGALLGVEEKSGLLADYKLRDIQVSVRGFEWNKVPESLFALPENVSWEDESGPIPAGELGDCVMVAHDGFAQAGVKNSSMDGHLLNLKTGRLRRLPYTGLISVPGCFLKDRREVVLSGFDLDGASGLVKVNLETGKNTPLRLDPPQPGAPMLADLSPDGKSLATLMTFGGGQMLNFQICVASLENKPARLLGSPQPIGAPFHWLPDGDGIVLKRFEKSENLKTIEPRVLCRLGLDGKLTDLRPGDQPVVLHKTRKILYEDEATRLWHTCDLDGTNPQLFADGLAKHGTPAVSPDETRVIFAKYDEGKLPQLLLFELGKNTGTPVTKARGFTGTPVWR